MPYTFRPLLLVLAMLGVYGLANAQFTKSIPLKPIYKDGWKYFYGTKKVNNAFALQIPLEGIESKEVEHYFQSFKTFQNLRGFSYLPSVVFLFTANSGSQQDAEVFLYLVLAGIAGDISFNIISHNKMGKAIDLYNLSISQRSSLSLQMERIKSNQTLISFGFRRRF